MGSAKRSRDLKESLIRKARETGEAIAKEGCILVTGACMGLPYEAAKAAGKKGGNTLAYSPASDFKEHIEPPISYPYPSLNSEIIFTGIGKTGRNVLSIKECDGVIFIGGGIGTFNEFSIAFHEGKVIGVLTGTKGVVEKILKLATEREMGRKTGAVLVFDPKPQRLVKKVIEKIKEREFALKPRKEIPITFLNQNNKQLVGIYHLPENVYKPPLVIGVCGFGQTKSDRKFVEIGRMLARRGIAFFRFDFEGCGDSEGELESTTVKNQILDLKSAFEAILKNADINNRKISFLGHSLGSVIASLFVNNFGLKVKTLAFWSPAFCQKAFFPIWHTAAELKRWRKKGYLIRKDKKIGIEYLRENEKKDYSIVLSKIKSPILILHGQKDEVVPIKFSEDLAKRYKNIKLIEIKNADHKFEDYFIQRQLFRQTVNWIEKHLKKQ